MSDTLRRVGLEHRLAPLRNRSDAEDTVQEVFLDIWKSAHRFDPKVAKESTFIAMVTRRRLIDKFRRDGRTVGTGSISEGNEPAAENVSSVEVSDEAQRVRQMMEKLSIEEQLVLKLAIDNGMSQNQIAEETQLPLGSVKSHARRGMLKLRTLLGVLPTTMKGGVR